MPGKRKHSHLLYHTLLRVGQLEGEVIYPLNRLRVSHPHLYALHAEKYTDRLQVMEQRIPILNCLWNDVVHLSPVHPCSIRKALVEVLGKSIKHFSFYAIPVEDFDPVTLAWWTFESYPYNSGEVSRFSPRYLDRTIELSDKTLAYYKERIESGQRPLWFMYTPHVFCKAEIDVSSCKLQSTGSL